MENIDTSGAETETVVWCAGLPAAGWRDLKPVEQRALSAMRARSLLLGWLLALAVPLVWLAAVIAVGLAPRSVSGSSALLLVLDLALVLATCGLAFAARRGFQRARLLRASRGCCRFEGRVEDALRDSAQAALLDKGWLEADAEPVQSIETIGLGGPVWTANGRRVTCWIAARAVETAITPPMAAIGAQWVAPVPGAPPGAPHVNRRSLSAAERMELVRYRRRMMMRALPFAIAVNAWTWWVIASSVSEGRMPAGRDAVTLCVLLLCTASTDLQLARYLRLCGRFARDIAGGQVVIIRTPTDTPLESTGSTGGQELGPAIETLPASRALWTVEGQPAPWRITPLR